MYVRLYHLLQMYILLLTDFQHWDSSIHIIHAKDPFQVITYYALQNLGTIQITINTWSK